MTDIDSPGAIGYSVTKLAVTQTNSQCDNVTENVTFQF